MGRVLFHGPAAQTHWHPIMCCTHHCTVGCSGLAKTVWSSLRLPELLYCRCIRLWKTWCQSIRTSVHTLTKGGKSLLLNVRTHIFLFGPLRSGDGGLNHLPSLPQRPTNSYITDLTLILYKMRRYRRGGGGYPTMCERCSICDPRPPLW